VPEACRHELDFPVRFSRSVRVRVMFALLVHFCRQTGDFNKNERVILFEKTKATPFEIPNSALTLITL
jgi:hypothetical protein